MYKILNLQRVENAGNLRATFAVQYMEVIYPDFRIVQQEGKKAWASAPVEKTEEGYKTRNPLPDSVWGLVKADVLRTWNEDSIGSTEIVAETRRPAEIDS
jgi:hypothetical protein